MEAQLGPEGMLRVRSARVVVAGLGGVGVHAALALARSGTGRLDLVDFDDVTETSLNRNPLACPGDVGSPKVEVVARELSRCCPDTEVTAVAAFLDGETLPGMLEPHPDALVDAIDSLGPKVTLLAGCAERGVPVFSSMGASGRSDPSAIRCGELYGTRVCPLAKQVRKLLRRRGLGSGVRCVWSEEPAGPVLPPDPGEMVLRRGRPRNVLPSTIAMPGIFGYALARMVLEHLAGTERE